MVLTIKWLQSGTIALPSRSLVTLNSDHLFADDHLHALEERRRDNAKIIKPLSPNDDVVG